MRKTLISGIAILAMAGCEQADITQAPVQYQATKRLNEKGVSNFTARTFAKVDNQRKEISGVPCRFSAPGFRASFQSPAVVITPDMGPRTPAGSITCSYNGADKLEVMTPFNETLAQIDASTSGAAASAGILGAIVATVAASSQKARRDASLDVFGYRDVRVTFD